MSVKKGIVLNEDTHTLNIQYQTIFWSQSVFENSYFVLRKKALKRMHQKGLNKKVGVSVIKLLRNYI